MPRSTPLPPGAGHRTVLAATLALTALAPAACTTADARLATTSRLDSAGVDIVRNTLLDGGEPSRWSVAAEPLLTIGTADGDEHLQFFGIAGLHRMADGRIGVLDAGSRQVRVFAADGAFLRAWGKQGSGPEEFEMPVMAGALGDTLLIIDRANHRLSSVHPDLGFTRAVRVADDVGGFLNPAGVLLDGQVVFGGAFDMRSTRELRTGFNRGGTFYRSCNPDGSLATDFGNVPGAEFWIEDVNADGPAARPMLIPFGRIAHAAASTRFFYYSDQDGFDIAVYSPAGDLVRSIRLDAPPVAVTEDDRLRYIDDLLADVPDPAQADGLRRRLLATPLPAAFPAHGALATDALDNLWVAGFGRPGAPDPPWLVFDPDGALVARLGLPDRFQPLEIGADYVLGVGRDPLGVEYVRLHRLIRG